jgi:PAS domain-containing protein
MPSNPSQSQNNLIKGREELQAVLETVTDGVLLSDEERKITAWNRHFVETWSIAEEQLASRDLQRIFELIAGARQTGGRKRDFSTTRTIGARTDGKARGGNSKSNKRRISGDPQSRTLNPSQCGTRMGNLPPDG